MFGTWKDDRQETPLYYRENWSKIRLKNIETVKEKLIARLISNVCRRHVSAKEKSEMLGRLGEVYYNEGIEPGKIAYGIAEETGMSYRWVMTYLPDKSKEKTQKRKVAKLATGDDKLFLDPHI